ncbi:MAG TPA: PQQ-binding-like beta-propeller repeat protein [Ktedonobacteraceae bacterium]|nr:PQQ-binding-like beta-propeller repeat protein [Ktedonobacteraceae bacterium]
MSDEQETPSLSEDNTDNTDDTIKIPRVKVPLNAHNTLQIDKDRGADELKLSLHANGNGHSTNGNLPIFSTRENQPYFEELTTEETAKLPAPRPDAIDEHGLIATHDEKPDTNSTITLNENNAVANEPDASHTASVEQDDATPSSPSSPSLPSSPAQTLPALSTMQPHNLQASLRPVARLWKFSRLLCIILLLMPVIAICIYAYGQLNHFQSNLYTVDAHTGTTLWQQAANGAAQTELVDAQGSVQIATLANNTQQLIALDAHGRMQWQSFSSDGVFALPSVHSAPAMVLATLSQQTANGYSLTLYSFNRATGHINWQYEITQPTLSQSEDILGADNNFIYAVNTQPLAGQQTQVQLLAINQYTGFIGWRVNSPAQADGNPLDKGSLLLTEHALVWQVDATIEVIDATQGSILWTTALPFSNISILPQEEAQMVLLHGQLVVERNDALHSYAMATGKKLWNVNVFDFSTGTIPASIATDGQKIFVYGNGQLEAVSYNDQHVIWQQQQMGNILGFHIANDGTLIYVILLDSIENSTPAQALVAFDTQNGAAYWTFQPSNQFTFLNPQANGFQYHRTTILATLCVTSTCNHPHLYALNAATGATLWRFEGNGVSSALLSSDGSIVSYVGNTSAWQQFIQGLSGW